MRARILLIVLALVVQVLVIAPIVQAVTITWTSTADFDGGTKASSAGNFEIETVTDNLGITAGSFELGSLKSDLFTFADTDADTFKWNVVADPGPCSRSIASGILEIVAGDGVASRCSVTSAATISGDIDARIQATIVTSQDFSIFHVMNEAVAFWNSGTTVDGAMIEIVPVGAPEDDMQLFFWTFLNAAAGITGCTPADVTIADTTSLYVRIRFIDGTNTWTFFSSTDGSSWTQRSECVRDLTGPWYIVPNCTDSDAGSVTCQFDNENVAAGTVDAGGFRTSGTWTSATQTYSGEVATTITITYSGASASNYIDAAQIVDSGGSVLFTDDTDRTSGTSAVITVSFVASLQANWGVRILLASGGAGTPTMEAVSVETAPPPAGSEPAPKGFPGFSISCTSQLNSLSCILGFPPPAPAGIEILESQWYVDGSFQGRGRALDPQRQEIELRSSWTLAIYRGAANVTVLVLLSNGQQLRQSRILDVDNSWVTLLLIVGSVAGISLILLQTMGKLEIRRKRVQDRKDRRTKGKEENWRWQLFEQK